MHPGEGPWAVTIYAGATSANTRVGKVYGDGGWTSVRFTSPINARYIQFSLIGRKTDIPPTWWSIGEVGVYTACAST